MDNSTPKSWLLLIHQIPPKPDYFRVKIWRRLQQVGAIAIKQSVYVLPQSDQTHEDFSWILAEIIEGGGDASLSEARFMEGLTDDRIVGLFQQARKADYEKLIEEVNAVRQEQDGHRNDAYTKVRTHMGRLQKRLDEITTIDFFSSPERVGAENAIIDMWSRLKGLHVETGAPKTAGQFLGKTWVTRKNVFIDRIASAWLVTRFIDPKASFKFVDSKNYDSRDNEIRFDMFEAEFTHQGDRCTFENILQSFRINENALNQIGEIVHDIDMKDRKFERPEADGLAVAFSGIVAAHANDAERIEVGGKLLDDLLQYFKCQM